MHFNIVHEIMIFILDQKYISCYSTCTWYLAF